MKISLKMNYWKETDIEKWKDRTSKMTMAIGVFALINIAMTITIMEGFAIETNYARILLNAIPLGIAAIGIYIENKTRTRRT